jgi:hypothetical protein
MSPRFEPCREAYAEKGLDSLAAVRQNFMNKGHACPLLPGRASFGCRPTASGEFHQHLSAFFGTL